MTSLWVTGHTGYIGSALVPALRQAGHSLLLPERHEVTYGHYDAKGPPKTILHLAADTMGDWHTNVLGTANVLNWCPSGSRFIFASTLNAADPHHAYEREKLVAEQIVRTRTDVTSVILRFGLVYGPGPLSKRSALNRVIQRAAAGESLTIAPGANGWRDFVYLSDAVQAIQLALTAPTGTYDVGCAQETMAQAIREVAQQAQVRTHETDVGWGPSYPLASPERYIPGWAPQVSLAEGIARTLAWAKSKVAA